MALTIVKKGSWDCVFDVSDAVIATLGKIIDKSKRGQYQDVSSGQFVGVTDKYMRREHQYRPDMGPKRLVFKLQENPPLEPVVIAASHKIGISTKVNKPYFLIDSPSLGEKMLVYESEGMQAVDQVLQKLIPPSEQKYATENKGEMKSDISFDYVIPRLAVFLKAAKPHRVDRANLESQLNTSFVTEVVIGAKMSGKIRRGEKELTEAEITAAAAAAAKPKAKPKSKSAKAKGAEIQPPIDIFAYEISKIAGTTEQILADSLNNKSLTDILSTLRSFTKVIASAPGGWQQLWIRSQNAENFLKSLPDTEEYPTLINCGRCTLSHSEALENIPSFNIQGMISQCKINTPYNPLSPRLNSKPSHSAASSPLIRSYSTVPALQSPASLVTKRPVSVINFDFPSKSRGVSLVVDADEAGSKLACKFSTDDSACTAFIGLRGFACGVTCSLGHLSIPEDLDSIGLYDKELKQKLSLRHCSRCIANPVSIRFNCGVCEEVGNICGTCAVSGLGFCPEKHALVFSELQDKFIMCEVCNKNGRSACIECPIGCHYRKAVCSDCVSSIFYPVMRRCLEPSPFEHCLAVTARVRLMNSGVEEAQEFSTNDLPKMLHLQDNKWGSHGKRARSSLTVSKIFASPEGHAEFRFTLQRVSAKQPPPFRNVVDFMLRCLVTAQAEVDVVEIDNIPVANADDMQDDSNMIEWLDRLNNTK